MYPYFVHTNGHVIGFGGDFHTFFWSHLWEKDHLLYATVVSEQHGEAVDSDSYTGGGGHAIFQGSDEVFIHFHGFLIPSLFQSKLLLKTLFLVIWVGSFRISVSDFFSINKKLKALHHTWLRAMLFGQR